MNKWFKFLCVGKVSVQVFVDKDFIKKLAHANWAKKTVNLDVDGKIVLINLANVVTIEQIEDKGADE